MTETPVNESLRERTRRAVRNELIDAARGLFAQHGYEAVTVDEIAAAAGMSKRSFFRYFDNKEALVLGKYDRQGERFAEALAARPLDETAWVALRRMFDDFVAEVTASEPDPLASEIAKVIDASDALRAGLVERMQRVQHLVVDVLRERETERGTRYATSIAATALVGAAFAALAAVRAPERAGGISFADALDEAMTAIGQCGPLLVE